MFIVEQNGQWVDGKEYYENLFKEQKKAPKKIRPQDAVQTGKIEGIKYWTEDENN